MITNLFFGNMFVLQLRYDYYQPQNLGLTLSHLVECIQLVRKILIYKVVGVMSFLQWEDQIGVRNLGHSSTLISSFLSLAHGTNS